MLNLLLWIIMFIIIYLQSYFRNFSNDLGSSRYLFLVLFWDCSFSDLFLFHGTLLNHLECVCRDRWMHKHWKVHFICRCVYQWIWTNSLWDESRVFPQKRNNQNTNAEKRSDSSSDDLRVANILFAILFSAF